MRNNNNGFETKRFKSSDVNKKSRKKASSETQRVGTVKDKIKPKKSKGKKGKNKHPKLMMFIKIFLIVFMLVMVILAGIVAGTFFGFFGDELKITEADLAINMENSIVYDKNGNELASLSEGTKRKSVSTQDMSEYLPKAYVAIEDERYYSHSGVDIKRSVAATVTYVVNFGNSSFGGSSITQQVIKNLTEETANSGVSGILRKVKEVSKAIQVEHYLSKDQILELYLNLIFVGGNDINGVALGSAYYFDKDVKDLSLAECAFMAGINHIPNQYKPFTDKDADKMKEKINKRTKTVLAKMKELAYINDEEYNLAISEVDAGLNFKNGEAAVTTEVSYHTEAAIAQIVNQVMEEKGINKKAAELYVYSGGLRIYTTQDTEMQNRLEEELIKEKYLLKPTKNKKGENQNSMANMVIIENGTGKVLASGSGIGPEAVKTRLGYFNWPTSMKKQTGSAMKPISVTVPGLEMGTITAATVYDDNYTVFGKDGYDPKNHYTGYKGLITMRSAIEISANIPHVKALSNIGVDNSIAFCKKVGITGLGDEGLSLALGGLNNGASVLQMAAAYSAIASDGIYYEPTFYEKVTDNKGEIILEPSKKSERVMSEANAYITKNILTQPVIGGGGTAKYCAISGMDVAAKTGTTNGDYDRWLCGFTPYYTAATWFGYEDNAKVIYSGNPAGNIWDEVMTSIHSGLEGKRFIEPKGIVKMSVCRFSGQKATESCTDVYTEMFSEKNQPSACKGHSKVLICLESNQLSNGTCTAVEERAYPGVPEKELNPKWSTKGGGTYENAPTEVCGLPHAPAHEHAYTETIILAATSMAPGVKTFTCACGHSYNEEIPVQAHTHAYTTPTILTNPTCTVPGERSLKCSCGDTKKEQIPLVSHNYAETGSTPATCLVAGVKTLKCSVCGHTKTEPIPIKAHTYDPVTGKCTTTGCTAQNPNVNQNTNTGP